MFAGNKLIGLLVETPLYSSNADLPRRMPQLQGFVPPARQRGYANSFLDRLPLSGSSQQVPVVSHLLEPATSHSVVGRDLLSSSPIVSADVSIIVEWFPSRNDDCHNRCAVSGAHRSFVRLPAPADS